ncbi:prefoldin subunit alpha [Candidatus Micrarchaeota archaeon]|nr:prefoldin subunit alpha [Candidatus Micrarchaeota archaeon]MBU1165729.1 prefoldin subunit alpha [Candidatus Micrarchaeota archaeon]MBU1887096.1 prefoldin subunit alpha [Candidatus Micrarchaeota archaeon]
METNSLEETQLRLNYELSLYREQISMIKRETERISLTTIDLTNALKTVENMKQDKVMIPIGGGALILGTITDDNVLVPIGAQYLTEMNRETAVTEMNRRIDATKQAVEKLTVEFDKIVKKLKVVSAQLMEIQNQSKLSRTVDDNIREDYR